MSGGVQGGAVQSTSDLEYASVAGQTLCLDLHRPADGDEHPLVVYFHGGGWMRGDRAAAAQERLLPLASAGVAVASVSYRFTDVATHPAQLDDARAAVSWLRGHGSEFGLRTERIGAWGASAGGWIALMLALTAPADESASVQAACALFPVTDLLAVDPERKAAALPPPPFAQGAPTPVPSREARLLGVQSLDEAPELARDASPLTHAARAACPVLLMHGDADGLVNLSQSERLHQALIDAGRQSELLILKGANHEGGEFVTPAALGAVSGFFQAYL